MTTQIEVMTFLAQCPEGERISVIAQDFGLEEKSIEVTLEQMLKNGFITRPERGLYILTERGITRLEAATGRKAPKVKNYDTVTKEKEKDPPPPALVSSVASLEQPVGVEEATAKEVPPVPGDYDKFVELGHSLGIRGEFLKVICDYIWKGGNPYNLDWVWEALNSLHLRVDTTHRWFRTWASAISVPVPPQLAQIINPSTSQALSGTGQQITSQQRFSIIDDTIVLDPDSAFSHTQCLQQLALKKGITPEAANALTPGSEKLSEIVTALGVYNAGQGKQENGDSVQSMLLKLVFESLKDRQPQAPITVKDMLDIADRLKEAKPPEISAPRSGLEEAEKFIGLAKLFQGLFSSSAPANGESAPPTVIQLGDGKIGLSDFLKIEDYKWQRSKEQMEREDKRDNSKSLRGFIEKLGKAAEGLARE